MQFGKYKELFTVLKQKLFVKWVTFEYMLLEQLFNIINGNGTVYLMFQLQSNRNLCLNI